MMKSNSHTCASANISLSLRDRAHLCITLRATHLSAALRAALRPYPIRSDMVYARHCDATALALHAHSSLICDEWHCAPRRDRSGIALRESRSDHRSPAMPARTHCARTAYAVRLPSRSAEAPMLARIGTVGEAPARPSRGRTLGLRSGSMAHAAIAASPRDRRNDVRLAYAPQGSPALPGAPRNRLVADCLDARTCGGGR